MDCQDLAPKRIVCFALLIAALNAMLVTVATAQNSGAVNLESPIPGSRTCFWYRGPFSADPYINLAYPDANVFYWSANFTMPEGSSLHLEGDFAHSRYQSLISYDQAGRPVQSLADYLIEPDAGNENPYRHGADRNAENRRFRVNILNTPPNDLGVEGQLLTSETRNELHAPIENGSQILLYRVYLPDQDSGPTGGSALPEAVLTLEDGSELRGQAACGALRAAQPMRLDPGALGIGVDQYRELTSLPGRDDTWPATNPPTWHIQMDRRALIGIYTGESSEGVRRSTGGFFPNPDNNYIRTVVNARHGKALVIRGKMPTTPKTYEGGAGGNNQSQLRYWSICSNQSFANTRVNDCLFDEELPLDPNGFYTIVVSKEADRPRNAIPACGIGWLPIADDGDGIQDPDVAIVQIRNMLAADDFEEAIQKVSTNSMAKLVMGPYFPNSFYAMPNAVEGLFPCPL